MTKRSGKTKAFTIIELLISLAIFSILAVGVLAGLAALSRSTRTARQKTQLASLASHYLEIVRNMPYFDVGTLSGNPVGTLPDLSNPYTQTIESTTYKIYYEVTFIDDPADGTAGGSPNDPAPADYKQVKMVILNTSTNQLTDFLTNVVPKGLEGLQNAGALKIKVFNASGQRVADADIHIEHPTTTPALILDRKTDPNGEWIEVGLPPAVNNYRIIVTKAGYSTDQTYPITLQNPNPAKPDSTIVAGVVTEVSFSIDLLSNLSIKILNEFCSNLDGVDMNVKGAKLIGTTPSVNKFNQDFTSSSGQVLLEELEWDTYTPTLLIGQPWVVRGTSPIQKIDVQPGTSQTFTMILGTNSTANSLLVVVKDASTNAALEGAQLHLHKGSPFWDTYEASGGSVWSQNNWAGGSGQSNWSTTTPNVYFADDGNIDVTFSPSGVRLRTISSNYATAGWLESSTFDTGSTSSNFTTLSWQPVSQNASTTLQIQLASATDPAGPFTYLGPDGTSNTFYEVSGTNISTVHDGQRYFRYKVFLTTDDAAETPILTSLQINYVSGCFTPGQYWFGDLDAASDYDLDVSLSGYQIYSQTGLNINGNQSLEVLLSP